MDRHELSDQQGSTGPIVVVSRSMPPDVGGYQRQMALVLPPLCRLSGRPAYWIGAVRDRSTGDSQRPQTVRSLRVPAWALPRRVRGLADVAVVAAAVALLLSSSLRRRRGSVLLLSPTMLLGRFVVALASTLRWRIIVRYPTAGDLTGRRGRNIGAMPGVIAVAPSQGQIIEQSRFQVLQVPNCVAHEADVSKAPSEDFGRFLFVGRLIGRKRPDLVVRAWYEIAHLLPGWKLELIGAGGDEVDSLDDELAKMLAELSVPRCQLSGRVSDGHRSFTADDILVFPSVREGLPNSVLEAMAAGTPVIAARSEAIGWFGYAPPLLEWDGDASTLPGAMLAAASASQRRFDVASEAQGVVRRRHDPEETARAYAELMGGSRRRSLGLVHHDE